MSARPRSGTPGGSRRTARRTSRAGTPSATSTLTIAAGELRLQAFGVTEPTAGSDTRSIQTTAEPMADGWVIRGQKIWTSRALYSDLMLLVARTENGLSTFLIDLRDALAAGTLTIRPLRTLMNHASTEVFL